MVNFHNQKKKFFKNLNFVYFEEVINKMPYMSIYLWHHGVFGGNFHIEDTN